MKYQDYLDTVKSKLSNKTDIRLATEEKLVAYEEEFRWEWIATKLKITSFVQYIPEITLDEMISYSQTCLKDAKKNKKGLPIGWQNGVLSYNVIVSENVTSEAIEFVRTRPKKHFAALEMPVIFDLSNHNLYYYQGDMIWGAIYTSFIRNYLTYHFYPFV